VTVQVGVVVVTHAGAGNILQRCVASVVASGDADIVVVVDNSGIGLDDGALGPDIDCTLRVENRGFGAAANVGFRAVIERLGPACAVALLNDDVTVAAGWLEPLTAALVTSAEVGGAQPKLLVAGTEPPIVNSVGVCLDRAGAGVDIGYHEPDGPEWSRAGPIEMFSGGAVLFRASFIEDLGGFDERFFLYYEDVDLALRGGERGWVFRCAPTSVVHHAGGASTAALGTELRRLQDRNRLWTAFRFGSRRRIAAALWLSIRRLRHHPRSAHGSALVAGLSGAPRRLAERRSARREPRL